MHGLVLPCSTRHVCFWARHGWSFRWYLCPSLAHRRSLGHCTTDSALVLLWGTRHVWRLSTRD